MIGNLGAGFCLAAALRCALLGGTPSASLQAGIAALLAAAGLAHLADMAARWRR